MNEQYVQIYINRHENLLFENIRKQIDLETKTLLFESQIKEYQARIEELEVQITSLNEMMVQATNGLSAVTIERDQYKGERDTCDLALADSNRQLNETRVTLQHIQNENNQLKSQIEALKNDFATQKSNYNLVRNELEERELIISKLKTELEATKLKYESKLVELENKYKKSEEPEIVEQLIVSTKKNLKKKTRGHEWVDGNEDTD